MTTRVLTTHFFDILHLGILFHHNFRDGVSEVEVLGLPILAEVLFEDRALAAPAYHD